MPAKPLGWCSSLKSWDRMSGERCLRADVHGERVRGAGTARDELVLGGAVAPVIV
jgi:hypothetical protein